MNIVKRKYEFLQKILRLCPQKIKKLFSFGLEILVCRSIRSLRANARLVPLVWNTAKSKVYRLLKNRKMSRVFFSILTALAVVGENDIVAIDFSDFGNGFQVLMFAKQTRKGRAVPLYFEILRYPIREGSQNLFVIAAIRRFSDLLGFKPKLVFDRGFAAPYIVKKLLKYGYIFYIRIKKKKGVTEEESGVERKACEVEENDSKVFVYDHRLRLVVSDLKKGVDEPWYIVTNDFRTSRKKIVGRYYHRFEIEEFFRDAKRLLGLEDVNFKKEESLAVTLWFVVTGTWFFWKLEEEMAEQEKTERKKLRLSVTRYYFEKLEREILTVAEGKFMEKLLRFCG